ncbi:MAG: bifunctional 4-hydroxy-2-oxoglutarate aldolase/2-dehydro-3-deoxy-phosphogluconate aldolase [Chloroflexota bacterium]|nr:bifunctional 4-hydroxy-2-oxoglutarate aldolase/2-dehydro-3-deoxy-phosphogluconate aldolase [Chloroflexota bacterium]
MDHASRPLLAPRTPIAIVRLDDLSEAVGLARALLEGGLSVLEFTLTNRRALAAIEQVRNELEESVCVGAGTVLDAESARAAIFSGAQFLVTPTLQPDVIACGRRYNVPVMCGALTPSEILTAWQAGAEYVKVFPARSLGPAYIRDVLAPLPGIRLIPTGGVNLQNCKSYLDAGAYAVAVGSNLVDPASVTARDWGALSDTARQYVAACAAQ